MYSNVRTDKGIRCQICTSCGLCPGVMRSDDRTQPLRVLAEDAMAGERLPLKGEGVRLAVADVGTTTIAMLLYNADGSVADRYVSVNPQTVYGADVLSRIHAAENSRQAEEMRAQVTGVLEQGIGRFQKHLAEGERLQLVLAANTTMTYLFMGWNPCELGQAPFTVTNLTTVETQVGGVPCFVFPRLSAFVGGDIVAGICACKMSEREELTLLVDLGTNGEMVLGNCNRRIACATAAGPAFEGGANKGIWGADMVSILATLRREEIVDETGLLVPEYFDRGIRVGNVPVTQQAIRSIQLAKAAIAAGIEILLKKYGVTAGQVDRVVLAGGFGYYLDPMAAAEIGLLSRELAEKTITGGNTALAGALLAGRELLADGHGRNLAKKLEAEAGDTEIVNLAKEPLFEKYYVDSMNF